MGWPMLLLLLLLMFSSHRAYQSQLSGGHRKKISISHIHLGERSNDFYPRVNEINTALANIQRRDREAQFELQVQDTIVNIKNNKLVPPKTIENWMCQSIKYDVGKFGNAVLLSSTDPLPVGAKDLLTTVNFFLHVAKMLGIPTFTYIAGAAGQLDSIIGAHLMSEKDSIIFRLEPTTWHFAQAFADFLEEFRWEKATLVVSENLPGHSSMIQHMKEAAEATQRLTDSNAFKFEIARVLKFPGVLKAPDARKCMENEKCMRQYKRVLYQLSGTEERVFIFYGMSSDLRVLIEMAKSTNLLHLFGSEFIWLISPPAVVTMLTDLKNGFSTELSQVHLPGMFGFYYSQDLFKAVRVAANVWYQGMRQFRHQLLSSGEHEADVVQKLHPSFNCTTSDWRGSYWEYGKRIAKIAKSRSFCHKCDGSSSETIGFDRNGVINSTEFLLVNTQIKKNEMKWFPVGSWSMSGGHDTSRRTKFSIDSVVWPGNSKTPPLGRPQKFRLRVATLEEDPFVTYRALEADGRCGETSLKCRVVMDNASEFRWPEGDNGNSSETAEAARYEYNCCSGLTIDLLRELMKDLDFDVDLFEVPDKKWGGWTTQGWNGLVRVLLEAKADLVLTALKITPNRSEQIDFSLPYHRTGITILVALREGAISTRAFLKPYDYPSWCLILVFSVHACGAALFLFEWLSPQGLDRGNVPPREHKFSLFRSLWLIWSMLFGAAVNADNPRGVASRFLGNIWALFALVFLASYTANLAAFMIAEESYYDLAGINDWRLMEPGMHRPPFRFATVPSGATEENVKMNFPRMAEYMRNYSKSNLDEGIKALKNHEIDAFIYDATVLQYRVGKDKDCKLKTVGNWYSMTGYGVGFPKGSKWKTDIDRQILIYRKNGLLERWSKYWFTGACQQSGRLRNSNQTLGVKNFISAFILLIGGMLLCCLLLVLEHWFYRYMRPRLKDFDKYGCCGLVSISMGQLLSFEQSVNQTVDLMKHHKCKNPICETQLWKLRHELDTSRRRLHKMEALLMTQQQQQQQQQVTAGCVTWADQQPHATGSGSYNGSNTRRRGLSIGAGGYDYLEISANSSEAELARKLQQPPEQQCQQLSTLVVPVQQHVYPSSLSPMSFPGSESTLPLHNSQQRRRNHPQLHQQQQQEQHLSELPVNQRFTRASNSSYQLGSPANQERPPSAQRSAEILYKHPSIRASPSTAALAYCMPQQQQQPASLDIDTRDDSAVERQTLVVKESVL